MQTGIERDYLQLPKWVPEAAENYLCHTVLGHSIRAVAKNNQCHPSTILRQVRRLEAKRDDPLIDAALNSFARARTKNTVVMKEKEMQASTQTTTRVAPIPPEVVASPSEQETTQILRRLCERGAVLAVAKGMETAVVVKEAADGSSERTAIVSSDIAQQFAVCGWISCKSPEAKIARYVVTPAGRRSLRESIAKSENRAQGFGDIDVDADESWDANPTRKRSKRYLVTESPLVGLARRRDKDGQSFLTKDQVRVGERLRQDYELSNLDENDEGNCLALLSESNLTLPAGVIAARKRLQLALEELGPGLADVSLQCCCLLNGLELTEKKMGWSSRSGKIVLRIALTRLVEHYKETQGRYEPMIG